jgi:hypothetical protein
MLFLPGSCWENRRLFVEFCLCWRGSANRDAHFNEKRIFQPSGLLPVSPSSGSKIVMTVWVTTRSTRQQNDH